MDSRTLKSMPAQCATVVVLAALTLIALPAGAHAAAINVTTTDDAVANDSLCSLREAIDAANSNTAANGCPGDSAGADTINLGPGTYKIEIAGAAEQANATGDFDITSAITIHGAGAASTTVDGA